jgi:hypothetical protein
MAAPTLKPALLDVLELERVSTNKQDLKRQKYDLAANRKEYGLNAVQTFSIKESGEKVLSTKEMDQIVAALPRVAGISVSAVDRIARPQGFTDLGFFQIFVDLKKTIWSKREGMIEPWTPRGRKTLMQALMQAGNELSDLKDRLASNRYKMHEERKMCNVAAPYAMIYIDKYLRDQDGKYHFDIAPQSFILDPAESSVPGLTKQQVVIDAFNWRYYNRLKISKILKRLNTGGILTNGKKGQFAPGLWSRTTVRQMLMNKHYIGEHWENGVLVSECPQLISREVFDGVQEMFSEMKRVSNGRNATRNLLCGYLVCKHCGHNYRSTAGRYPAYCCGHYDYKSGTQICRANSKIRTTKIEALIWPLIWAFLTQPEILLGNAKAYYDALPTPAGTAKLEAEAAALAGNIRRTGKMVKLGTCDEDEGNAEILAWQQRVREIEAELKAAGRVISLPDASLVAAGCRKIAEGPSPSSFDTRRPILERLVDLKFTFDNGFVEIEGKVPVAEAHKCDRRVHAAITSVLYIPFYLKERVEEASPEQLRTASLKGWETRRKKRAA